MSFSQNRPSVVDIRLVALFACIAFFVAFASTNLSAAMFGPISVDEIQMAENRGDRTAHGYVEYRFRVINRDSRARRVDLVMPRNSGGYSMQAMLTRSTSGTEIPAGATATIRLLQPPIAISGSNEIGVSIDGRMQRDGASFTPVASHIQGYAHRSNDIAHIFASQSVPAETRDLFRLEYGKAVTPAATHGASVVASSDPELVTWLANIPVEDWSDNWLAYTRFDCVAITPSDWTEMESRRPQVQAALRKYAEAGGMLCIAGTDWKAPTDWIVDPNDNRRYRAVFGQIYLLDNNLKGKEDQINPFREEVLKVAGLWRRAMGDPTRSPHHIGHAFGGSGILSGDTSLLNSMPTLAHYGVSIKLIMILIIVFAVLIGPVNIYVLSLIKRRIWLLWTVPLTSLIASVLVLGASFLQEGFLRQSSSASFTVLDQRSEEATTIGFVGFYATLTPRGIVFSPGTEATACLQRGYGGENRSLELNIIGGGNQFLSRGWIHARVPSYFALRKAESQRKERINFDWSGTHSGDAATATNGLGVDVKRLVVRSPEGFLYEINEIKAGEKATLVKIGDDSKKPEKFASLVRLDADAGSFLQSGPSAASFGFDALDRNRLPAGCYQAELDAWNPFVEPGIEGMTPYQNKTILYGIFE